MRVLAATPPSEQSGASRVVLSSKDPVDAQWQLDSWTVLLLLVDTGSLAGDTLSYVEFEIDMLLRLYRSGIGLCFR
jgi:hypothetical protein